MNIGCLESKTNNNPHFKLRCRAYCGPPYALDRQLFLGANRGLISPDLSPRFKVGFCREGSMLPHFRWKFSDRSQQGKCELEIFLTGSLQIINTSVPSMTESVVSGRRCTSCMEASSSNSPPHAGYHTQQRLMINEASQVDFLQCGTVCHLEKFVQIGSRSPTKVESLSPWQLMNTQRKQP